MPDTLFQTLINFAGAHPVLTGVLSAGLIVALAVFFAGVVAVIWIIDRGSP